MSIAVPAEPRERAAEQRRSRRSPPLRRGTRAGRRCRTLARRRRRLHGRGRGRAANVRSRTDRPPALTTQRGEPGQQPLHERHRDGRAVVGGDAARPHRAPAAIATARPRRVTPIAPATAATRPSTATTPITSTALSFSPNVSTAKSLRNGGARSIICWPTATTGDGTLSSAATPSAAPSPAPAARSPQPAPASLVFLETVMMFLRRQRPVRMGRRGRRRRSRRARPPRPRTASRRKPVRAAKSPRDGNPDSGLSFL